MKITFGRKFLGCVIATVLLCAMFFVTLFVYPSILTSLCVISYGVFVLTIWFAYIGGNVWSKWVKSKYFRGELNECNS